MNEVIPKIIQKKGSVPDKGRREPGRREKRRLRYIFVSSLSSAALCGGGSKKAGYVGKQGQYLIGNYLPVQGTEPPKK